MFDLIIKKRQPSRRPRAGVDIAMREQDCRRRTRDRRPGERRKSMRPAGWYRRPSSIRISIWTRRCRSACRG